MDFLTLAQTRYACKAYDATKKIPPTQLDQLLEILRLSPSSINIQPWQFIVAQSQSAKEKITQATQGNFAYNTSKILNCSEVIVFCAKSHIDDAHIKQILDCEEQAGRFRTPDARLAQQATRQSYVELYRKQNILDTWVDNQLYIALGTLLSAAQTFDINATPIGGFDNIALDKSLDLTAQGLRSVVIATLGYHSEADFNAALPKARLATNAVISRL